MRSNNAAGAIELRRGEVDRINAGQSQYFKVSGEIEVDGAGEAVIAVTFPVLFVNKPAFSFGAELSPGQPLVSTQLPTASLVVTQWGERTRADGSIIYSGATFAAVTTGPVGQVTIIAWHMEGVGLRGPT